MPAPIAPARITDLHEVLAAHPRYWGDRDLRALHLRALIQEFPETCLVARAEDGIQGYVIGFVTPGGTGYVHLIAVRDDAKGTGLGRALYEAFSGAARRQGAVRLKAITSTGNTGSVAFHKSLGFEASVVDDYNGPVTERLVLSRSTWGRFQSPATPGPLCLMGQPTRPRRLGIVSFRCSCLLPTRPRAPPFNRWRGRLRSATSQT